MGIEVETAISCTGETEQNYLRHSATKVIKRIIEKQQYRNTKTAQQEWNILKNIKKQSKRT
jgi:hypothetical protein